MGVKMKKKVTIIIIIIIIMTVIALAFRIKDNNVFKYHTKKVEFSNNGNLANSENRDNIYFFHTGSSDCMLIESNGHYGLVDTSNRYSRTITDSNGETYVVTQNEALSNQDYFYSGKDIAKYIVNALGVDHIDFVVGTHGHSDHIGGVEEICSQKLSDGSYLIDNRTRYFYKTYYHMNNINDDLDENGDIISRTGTWHNQAFVYRAVKSMQDRGAKIINVSNGVKISNSRQTVFPNISNIGGSYSHLTNAVYKPNNLYNYYDDYISFNFGNYNIRLYNLFTGNSKNDENVNSILTLITKADTSILLTGDINVEDNTEALLAKEIHNQIGEIDLYKIAHHANNYSNSKEVYDYLKPKYCVATKGGGDPIPFLCQRHYANKKYGTDFYETQLIDKAVVANIGNDNITFYELYDENNNSNNRDTYNPMYRQLGPRSIFRSGKWSGWFNWASYNYNNYMFLEESGNLYNIKKGWFYTSEAWRYANDDGLIQYRWNYIDNEWYYFAGYREIKLNDNSYYPESAMVEGWQWLKFDNNSYWFYFTPEPNSIKKEGSNEYYPEGSMVQGWQYINYEGKNRLFYLSKGVNDIAGYPRGAMITGKHNVEYNGNNNYYYFCKETNNPSGYVMGEMLRDITYEGNYYNENGVMVDNNPPEITVSYNITTITNQNVMVTINSNEEIQEIDGWTISQNKKQLTKQYEENTTEEITLKDLVGNTSNVKIEVTNIDKTLPIVEVVYDNKELTNQNVTVTITANEEIQEVEGWTRGEDKKTLTKEFEQNVKEETVQVKDIAGNTTNTEISINNIDKESPVIEGLENGKLYKDSVIATTTDQNLETLILEKDGEKVEGYTNGKEITEEGTYKLTATDKAGNSTEVSFTIQYERGELNKNNQIDIGDILLLLRHIAQANSEKVLQKHPQWKLENKDVIIGDINRNNKIDIGDVLKLQRYMAAKANESVADKHPDWLNIE